MLKIFCGADHRANLIRLNRKLVPALIDLMDALEKCPSQSSRELEAVLAIQNNLMHVCNTLRVVQARATLIHTLQVSIARKEQLLDTLGSDSSAVTDAVRKALQGLVSLDVEPSGSG
jgi:hypothetical protein